jgi:signal transduction histidine kinase
MEDVHLDEFVLAAVRATASSSVAVDLDDEARRTVVRADKRRLERVVGNLIANAERHAGGVARVVVERSDGLARICVDDRGAGVPADERESIFEPFVRGRAARRADGGAGLGLSLVAEHVRAHQGRVWVEDRAGGGSRFVVELPVQS